MTAIDTTAFGISKALRAFLVQPTIEDLDRWERTLPDRPYREVGLKMAALFSVQRHEPISVAKKYLTLTHSRLVRGARMRPERFDPNKLFCCKAMLALIERYEREAA